MPRIQITGVTHQQQLNPRACWYTTLQMVVRYYENEAQQSLGNLQAPDTFSYMQARFTAGSNPSWAEWRTWAQKCGFTPLDLCPNAHGIYTYLHSYGPILYSGTWGNSFDGHVVVITGVDTTSGDLFLDDPLERSAPVVRGMDGYLSTLVQTLWENPLFVYAG
jgi:Papain-like cysteine protease AvrRpt2